MQAKRKWNKAFRTLYKILCTNSGRTRALVDNDMNYGPEIEWLASWVSDFRLGSLQIVLQQEWLIITKRAYKHVECVVTPIAIETVRA